MFQVAAVAIRRQKTKALAAFGLLGVVLSATISSMPAPAVAAVGINKTINFQGKVVNTNGTNVANGSYTFVFKLYSVASAGTANWTETKSLTVTDGVFQTNLGDVTTLPGSVDFNTDNIYMGITFSTDAEMSPRIQFTAAAYAFNAGMLGGITAAGFAQLNPASAQAGSLNVTGSLQAATSLQAPLVDTATAMTLNIGTSIASAVNIGKNGGTVTIQGNLSSSWKVISGSFNSTVNFTTPTQNNAITFPNAGGTVCTTTATTCSATYQTVSATGYLLKNAADTSSASTVGTLLGLTNTNVGAAGVLSLTNSGTNSALSVTQSGNPSAGQALILANNTNGVPSGNLIDLQVGGTSKFIVTAAGNVSAGTYNGQTISSAASFTGTVAVTTSVAVPLVQTADSAAAGTAALTLRSGNVTGGSGLSTGGVSLKSGDGTGTDTSTGNVTLDSGAKSGSGFAGNLNIGTTNAPNVTIGRNGAAPATVSIQGAATSSALVMSNAAGTFSSTIAFANPVATTTTTFSNAGGTVCTTVSSTCSATYLVAGTYLAKNAADTSTAGVAGYLLGLTNTSGNVLQLTGAGTGSAFSVSQSGNPVAGSAVIFANNTNGAPTGNLIDLQAASVSKFSVTSAGAVTAASTINAQTISATAQFTGTVTSANAVTVQAGGIAVTGNSNITGTLGVTSNVTVSAGNLTLSNGTLSVTSASQNSITGGLLLSGGLNNNTGGITNAGLISGATTISASGTITGGGAFKSADAASTSAVTLMSGNASAGTSGNVTIDAGTATSTTGTVNVGTSNAFAINVGNAAAPVTVQGSATSKLVFGNSTISAVSSATVATYQFAAPTSATTYNICTSDSGSCTSTFLRKNIVNEQSSAGVGASQYLYQFTNTGAATGDVLQLNSGTGTGSALKVTAAANAGASNALIFAKLTNAAIGGNLLDLWSGVSGSETSKFAVAAGGAVTSGTINGQTLGATSQLAILNTSGLLTASSLTVTSAANFNGAATVTGLLTANGGLTVTGGITNNAGGITSAGAVSGLTSLQFNTNGTIDTSAANSLTIGGTNANAITLGRTGVTTTTNGTNQIGASAGNGALINNGSTVNSELTLGNFVANGAIGTAAATVDKYTYVSLPQTSAGITLTIPTPTAITTYGRVIYVSNIGTVSFTMLGTVIGAGSTATLVWANKNGGAAWTYAGADGSGILNQNTADQTADFRISGTGRANTSFTGPLFDALSGGALNLGTSAATGISLGKTGIVTAASGTFQVGASAGTGTLVNNGATINTVLAIANLPTGGSIGTNAATVDIYTYVSVAQTTAGQTMSIPAPTASTAYGRVLYISNIGTASFTLLNTIIGAGSTATLIWANTSGGPAWTYAGADGSGILNQTTADQAANFRITGTGVLQSGLQIGGTAYCSAGCGDLNFATGVDRVLKVLAAAASTAGNNLTVRAGDGGTGTAAGGNLVLQGGAASGGAAGGVVTVKSQTNSTTAFTVQNAISTAQFTVDTANSIVMVGDTTNGASFASTRELSFVGTARHAKNLTLAAEFAGAVLDADGTANNGTMTAAFEATQRFGYYKWVTNQASAQDYDIVATVPVPDDFSAWTGSPTFWNYGSLGSTMTVTITDTAGTTASNYNASGLTTSTTWTARSVTTPAVTGTYTQGSNLIIRIHMTAAATTGDVRLGTITLPYLTRW